MNNPEPSIRIHVDLTNPGQFFACCGLLELADRLWLGAEGWFEFGSRQFCIACPGSLKELVDKLVETELHSSLTDEKLKRLGSLLSARKSDLTAPGAAEKERLRAMWQHEQLHLEKPFNLCLDWWRDERGERTEMKTWAAKQFVLKIARPLLRAFAKVSSKQPLEDVLQFTTEVDGLPFYFDSASNSQNTARDLGFSLYDLRRIIKTRDAVRPALELLSFFGFQRFRPVVTNGGEVFRFTAWQISLPPVLAKVAVTGLLAFGASRTYEFRLLNRSDYMKAFLPATEIGAST